MKTLSHNAKAKFSVGEKVYYKRGSKIGTTTIREVVLETRITKNGTTNSIYYTATAYSNYSYYRSSRNFTEHQIFNSKEAAKKRHDYNYKICDIEKDQKN